MRTLGSILATDSTADVTRLGWPTLRAGFPLMTVLNAMREMRAALARRAGEETPPVMAVIGGGADQDRSIAALNIALAAARDGAKVLLIDADLRQRALSGKVSHLAKSEPSRFGWLNIGAKTARAIETTNGISILPAVNATEAKACDAIRKAIAQARSAGGYDLVILDGPAMPWSPTDRKLLDLAEGLVAILPVHLDINDSMEDIIAALGGTERKLVGVVLSEVNPTAVKSAAGQAICVSVALNPVGRAATASVPRITLGGLRLAVLDLEQTANFMIEMVFPQRRLNRPLYLTSANGEVLARCSTEPMTDRLFRAADLINADGQPLVTVSRFRSKTPLPERVATTDLFHVVARKAQAAGLTFYMLGADEAENAAAVASVREQYPDLKIVGRCHGFLRGEALRAKVAEINALAPDYLWVALGVPYEQAFVEEFTPNLSNVGVIKTSGGLFNFLSGSRVRAPVWMQHAGLEWAWRIWLEPRRLFWRYLTTNPRALYLLLNRGRSTDIGGTHNR